MNNGFGSSTLAEISQQVAQLWLRVSASPVVERVGWTLVHSLWLLVLIAIGYVLFSRFVLRQSAHGRYLAACGTLLAMVAVPIATFFAVQPMGAGQFARMDGDAVSSELASEMAPPSVVARGMQQPRFHDVNTPLPRGTADADGDARWDDVDTKQGGPPAREVVGPAANLTTGPLSMLKGYSTFIAARIQSALPLFVAAWLVGVMLISARPLLAWHITRRLRRLGISDVPQRVSAVLRRTARRVRLWRFVEIVQSSLVSVPCVVGYLRPIILLPAGAITQLTPQQLEAVIAHELAHVRRHDYLVNLVQTMVETLLFYHPAVWWISRQIRREREYCCDDLAMSICPDRAGYAKALVAMDQLQGTATQAALAATGGSLLGRIRRIAGKGGPTPQPSSTWVACLVLLSVTGAAATGIIAGQNLEEAQAAQLQVPASETNLSTASTPSTAVPQSNDVAPQPVTLSSPAGPINSVAFSPDGRLLAIGSGTAHEQGHLFVWDTEFSQTHLSFQAHDAAINDLAFSPDGAVLVTAASRGASVAELERAENIKLWDTAACQHLATHVGQRRGVTCIAFSPDGTTLASGSFDGTVYLRQGFALRILNAEEGGISNLAFSPDGESLAVGCYGGNVELWEVATGKRHKLFQAHDRDRYSANVAFSPSGTTLGIGTPDGNVRLWDAGATRVVATFQAGGTKPATPVFALSPDGKLLAAAAGQIDQRASIKVWDVSAQQVVATHHHDGWVSSLAFSPDGKSLASGGYDGTAKIWPLGADGAKGTPVASSGESDGPPFTNKIVFFGSQHPTRYTSLIQMMNPDGTDLTTLLELEDRSTYGGRISPDGHRVAFTVTRRGSDSSEVWVMDVEGKHEVIVQQGRLVSWSPSGDQILCSDGERHQWKNFVVDLSSKQAQPISLSEGHLVCDWAPNSDLLAVMAGNKERRFELRPDDFYPRRQLYFAALQNPGQTLWTTPDERDCIWGRFSPDGQKIAHYAREYAQNKPWELGMVVDRSGENSREVLRFADLSTEWQIRPSGGPCWSPDGRQVAWMIEKRKKRSDGMPDHMELLFAAIDDSTIRRMQLKQNGITFWGKIDWR